MASKISHATKRLLLRTASVILVCYLLLCTALYFFQERLIFFPEKLPPNFRFAFNTPFEELRITAPDGQRLHGLLFKTDSAKGLVFYLHGNAGSLRTWGEVAERYTALRYDVFLLDYRGFGKSEGRIQSQQQLFNDVQTAYDTLKGRYDESRITILGYSIGTGIAAHLASTNRPRLLVLQAPYYSLTDMMKSNYPFVPTFLLRYKLATNDYLKQSTARVALFHGDADEVIPYSASLQLKRECPSVDTLVTLGRQGHNGITDHPDYLRALQPILGSLALR